MVRSFVLVALCGAALACSAPAHADTASGTLDVSLRILPGCSVTAAPLAFVAEAGARAEAEATIDVRCAGDTSVSVSLDNGMNAAGAQRQLVNPGGTAVPYAIYIDPARTRRWEGEQLRTGTDEDGTLQLVAYGRIEARDTAVATGDYRDTVTVTLAF
jgi:spore coat protein U-like protein